MTQARHDAVRTAVGALNSWISSGHDMLALATYLQDLRDGDEPDVELQAAARLTVVGGLLVKLVTDATGRNAHEVLADIVEFS